MMRGYRKKIRLKESELRRIIAESVKRVLNEEYRDLGTTSGLSNYELIFRLHDELKRLINSNKDEWDFLHSNDGHWDMFFNRLKDAPERMYFYSKYREDANQDVIDVVAQFVKKCQNIPYPELSISSGTSFVEKANSLKRCLKYAYRLYDDFINYLLSRHEDDDIKQKDMEADWSDFENDRQKFVNDTTKKAETDASFRKELDPWGRSHKRGALNRYDSVVDNDKDYNDWIINYKGWTDI